MDSDSSLKEHLYSLETKLLKSEIRKSKKELEQLLADDFEEFTSSGRRKNKQDCLNGLEIPKMNLFNFEIKPLSSNIVLTTYDLTDETRMKKSLRSSLWRLIDGKWQMIFHQGTLKESDQNNYR